MQWSRGTFHENIQKKQYRFDRITVFVRFDLIRRNYHITAGRIHISASSALYNRDLSYHIRRMSYGCPVGNTSLHKRRFYYDTAEYRSLFLSEQKSDCTFKHVHFDPNMFSNIILENEGVYPITLMHAVLFSSQFYYRFSADDVIDSTLDKLISLYPDSDGLFPAANINISLINLMLYILDHTKPAHHFQTRSSRTVMLLTRWIILRSIIPRRSYRKILRHSFIFLFAI